MKYGPVCSPVFWQIFSLSSITEYNEAEAMELFKADGIREGTLKTLFSLVKRKLLSSAVAAKEADMTEEAFNEGMKEYEKETENKS